MKLICQNDNCKKEFQGNKGRKFCCLQCCWDWRRNQIDLPGTFKKGQVSPNKGKAMPQQTRDKISETKTGKPVPKLQGRIFTPEWKEKLRLAKLNQSEETKAKNSEAHKGKTPWNKGIKWIEQTGENNPFYGRHHTVETKRTLSMNHPMLGHPGRFYSRARAGFREDLGVYVRSSWEANMMRIFRSLGLQVEYEPKTFALSDGTSYTPDFYIQDTDEFIEVKGFYCENDKKKISSFKKEYPEIAFSMIFEKEYKNYLHEFKSLELEVVK